MNELGVVSYLGTDYLWRIVDEPGGEHYWCMADRQLGKIISERIDSDDASVRDEALDVDERFYCYVPLSVLIQPEEDIMKWCTDNGIEL